MPWGKQWLSVEGLQVPLLVRVLELKPGQVDPRLVSLIGFGTVDSRTSQS